MSKIFLTVALFFGMAQAKVSEESWLRGPASSEVNIEFSIDTVILGDDSADASILFIPKEEVAKMSAPDSSTPVRRWIFNSKKFEGKIGQTCCFPIGHIDSLMVEGFVGIGDAMKIDQKGIEEIRRALGSVISKLREYNVSHIAAGPIGVDKFSVSMESLVRDLATTLVMSLYKFDCLKTDGKKWNPKVTFVPFEGYTGNKLELRKAFEEGVMIGKSVNMARYLADIPPNYLNPEFFAKYAERRVAKENGLEFRVFGRERALELGMGGFCAVDSGSTANPGRFVTLEYKCGEKDAKKIALVGKGVTFDSGGLTLKPFRSMTDMKYDMCGAASVLATMNAVAQLKPKVNVVGIMPLVENMPDGKACRQDDVITHMNGKTTEIQNTDAEGRLILADALCYAEKFHSPDVIIDVATLTGGCLHSLGHFYSAVMTRDTNLREKIISSGTRCGERMWPLPLDDDFKAAIKSEVADVANSGIPKYFAGTVTAGMFLENFVTNSHWAHIDIAGTAHGVPDISYVGGGATGVPVRTFIDLIKSYEEG
ncbi:leucyl aminopeptidase [bacterium]|nr:leucyl aminopeptidase [bacterium]